MILLLGKYPYNDLILLLGKYLYDDLILLLGKYPHDDFILLLGKYPYDEVLAKSLLFYEAERSGPLPSDNRFCPIKSHFDGHFFTRL